MASIYFWPVRWIAFFLKRDVDVPGCWKLASAAMMPGTICMSIGFILYGIRRIELIEILIIGLLHFTLVWIYLFISPFLLPKLTRSKTGRNPFKKAKWCACPMLDHYSQQPSQGMAFKKDLNNFLEMPSGFRVIWQSSESHRNQIKGEKWESFQLK